MSPIGTSRTSRDVRLESAKWAKADIGQVSFNATGPNFQRTKGAAPRRGPPLPSTARQAITAREPLDPIAERCCWKRRLKLGKLAADLEEPRGQLRALL